MASLESIAEQNHFAAEIDIVSRTIPHARSLLRSFDVEPESAELVPLVTLDEIVRKCQSIVAMARPDAWTGIVPVARSVFESYADLCNLIVLGHEYSVYMFWLSQDQLHRFFSGINANPSSQEYANVEAYFRSKSRSVDWALKETARQKRETDDRLSSRFKTKSGYVREGVSFRFGLAGLEDEYNSVYRLLCGGTHGNLSDISGGIFDSGEFQWPPGPEAPPLLAAQFVADKLIDSCVRLARGYNRPIVRFARLKRVAGRRELRNRMIVR